jgi:hypothetical protein
LTIVCLFRYSILPAISLDDVLHLDIQDHLYTAATFNEFIEGLLNNMNPFPQKNSIIMIMVVGRNVLGRSVGNVGIQKMTRNGYILGVVTKFPQSKMWWSCITMVSGST